MTEQRTTPEQREMLRQRYLVNPGTLSCFVCQEAMELLPPERDKIGVLWTWRCPCASEHSSLRYIDHYADLDVIDAVDDADALAGSLVEAARLQVLVDACVDVLGRAMVRSDGYALHLAGFRVWEMLTGVPEAPAMEGNKDD